MRKIRSLQRNVRFIFCPYAITIDKRDEWGNDPKNLQRAPHGAFLKISADNKVLHLVQANSDGTAPVGWIRGDTWETFHKTPIWIEDEVLEPGTIRKMRTRDGIIKYQVAFPSLVCYNDKNGEPDLKDGWIIPVFQARKDYFF